MIRDELEFLLFIDGLSEDDIFMNYQVDTELDFDDIPDVIIDISPVQSDAVAVTTTVVLSSPEPIEVKKQIEINLFNDWSNFSILKKPYAIDTETTGMYPVHRIRLIQVYMPTINQVALIDLWELTPEQTRWVTALIDSLADETVEKYIQNAMFDCFWFRRKFGIVCRNVIDLRLLSQIKKAGLYDGYLYQARIMAPNSLGYISTELGYDHDKTEQRSKWSDLNLTESQKAYGCRDPIMTHIAGKKFYDHLLANQYQTVDAEMRCIPVFVELQHNGLPCDLEYLKDAARQYRELADKLKTELSELLPYDPIHHQKVLYDAANPRYGKKGKQLKPLSDKPFNVASPAQVVQLLVQYGFTKQIKKFDKKTGEEKESSGKDVIFECYSEAEEYVDPMQVDDIKTNLKAIINFRSIARGASTLESYIDSYDSDMKSIRTKYSILATQGMGRSSSGGKPEVDYQNTDEVVKYQNAQNFSKYLPSHAAYKLPPIRSVVRARPGYSLVEIDLAASHAQFARYLSKDESLQESYESGVKLHYYTLSAMLALEGVRADPKECMSLVTEKNKRQDYYKHLYKLAKIVFYSFLNYSGGATLQNQFFKYELFISLKDCNQYLQACANQFWQLRVFQENVHKLAESRIARKYSEDGRDLGFFGYSVPCDGSIIWHRAQWNRRSQLAIKISDVVSAQWLRPEATVMKSALADNLDFFIDSGYGDNDVRYVNFSHDSYMLEIRNELIEEIVPVCYDNTNRNMKRFVLDYEPEDSWQASVLGECWK